MSPSRERISSLGTTCSHVSSRMSPTGISSMNRTCHGCSSVRRARSTYLVVVDAAHHDHVQLDGVEAGGLCGQRGANRIEPEVSSRDVRDAIRAQTVDAHVDAVEPALAERLRDLRQPHAIRRDRDVLDLRHRAQHANQLVDLRPDRRLAAGHAQPTQPERRELPDDLRYLFVRQDVRLGQPREALGRHAVHAAEVAAVRHRDPQILDAPSELVERALSACISLSPPRSRDARSGRPTRASRRRSARASRSARVV